MAIWTRRKRAQSCASGPSQAPARNARSLSVPGSSATSSQPLDSSVSTIPLRQSCNFNTATQRPGRKPIHRPQLPRVPPVGSTKLESFQILSRVYLEDYSNSVILNPQEVAESRLGASTIGSFFPPTYSDLAPVVPSAPILPRENEGFESLPGYKTAVYREGLAHKKTELVTPYLPATYRLWTPVYIQLNNTQLNMYLLAPTPLGHNDPYIDPSRLDLGISYFSQESPDPTPLRDHELQTGSTENALVANGRYRVSRLLRSYTLQYADVGAASDYVKRTHVLRIRAEAEQFLLQLSTVIDFVAWAHSLQTAIDISLPLDERPLPRTRMIPRRNRRHRTGQNWLLRSLESTNSLRDLARQEGTTNRNSEQQPATLKKPSTREVMQAYRDFNPYSSNTVGNSHDYAPKPRRPSEPKLNQLPEPKSRLSRFVNRLSNSGHNSSSGRRSSILSLLHNSRNASTTTVAAVPALSPVVKAIDSDSRPRSASVSEVFQSRQSNKLNNGPLMDRINRTTSFDPKLTNTVSSPLNPAFDLQQRPNSSTVSLSATQTDNGWTAETEQEQHNYDVSSNEVSETNIHNEGIDNIDESNSTNNTLGTTDEENTHNENSASSALLAATSLTSTGSRRSENSETSQLSDNSHTSNNTQSSSNSQTSGDSNNSRLSNFSSAASFSSGTSVASTEPLFASIVGGDPVNSSLIVKTVCVDAENANKELIITDAEVAEVVDTNSEQQTNTLFVTRSADSSVSFVSCVSRRHSDKLETPELNTSETDRVEANVCGTSSTVKQKTTSSINPFGFSTFPIQTSGSRAQKDSTLDTREHLNLIAEPTTREGLTAFEDSSQRNSSTTDEELDFIIEQYQDYEDEEEEVDTELELRPTLPIENESLEQRDDDDHIDVSELHNLYTHNDRYNNNHDDLYDNTTTNRYHDSVPANNSDAYGFNLDFNTGYGGLFEFRPFTLSASSSGHGMSDASEPFLTNNTLNTNSEVDPHCMPVNLNQPVTATPCQTQTQTLTQNVVSMSSLVDPNDFNQDSDILDLLNNETDNDVDNFNETDNEMDDYGDIMDIINNHNDNDNTEGNNGVNSNKNDDDDDEDLDSIKWTPEHPSESLKLITRCIKPLPAHSSWVNKIVILDRVKYLVKKDDFVKIPNIAL